MKWKMITCCKMKQVLKPKDFEKLLDVIRVLEVKREISVQEVMKITQKSRTTAWRYMKTLVELGVVEAEGNTNNMIYRMEKDSRRMEEI